MLIGFGWILLFLMIGLPIAAYRRYRRGKSWRLLAVLAALVWLPVCLGLMADLFLGN